MKPFVSVGFLVSFFQMKALMHYVYKESDRVTKTATKRIIKKSDLIKDNAHG